jgi:hypothetical protein
VGLPPTGWTREESRDAAGALFSQDRPRNRVGQCLGRCRGFGLRHGPPVFGRRNHRRRALTCPSRASADAHLHAPVASRRDPSNQERCRNSAGIVAGHGGRARRTPIFALNRLEALPQTHKDRAVRPPPAKPLSAVISVARSAKAAARSFLPRIVLRLSDIDIDATYNRARLVLAHTQLSAIFATLFCRSAPERAKACPRIIHRKSTRSRAVRTILLSTSPQEPKLGQAEKDWSHSVNNLKNRG